MNKEKQIISVEQPDARKETSIKVRRGRTAVAIALAGGLFAGGIATGVVVSDAVHEANQPMQPSGETITVYPGDNLWNIAEELAPNKDPREVVDQLMELNNIVDAMSIQPGQTISIPIDLATNPKDNK